MKNNGHDLYCASEDLKKDKEIVLEVVKNDGYALLFASEDLCSNRQFILEAMKNNGWAFKMPRRISIMIEKMFSRL